MHVVFIEVCILSGAQKRQKIVDVHFMFNKIKLKYFLVFFNYFLKSIVCAPSGVVPNSGLFTL